MTSRLCLLLAMLALMSVAAVGIHAQTQAATQPHMRFQLYCGYTFLSNSFNGLPGARQPLNGWDASISVPGHHDLHFKFETSGYRGTNQGASQNSVFIMGGAQYSHRLGRETVFVEGMGGDGGINKNWGAGATTGETASFAALMGGGLDTPLTRRIAFRVSGGYQYSYFALVDKNLNPYRSPGLPTNFERLSSGLVFQF